MKSFLRFLAFGPRYCSGNFTEMVSSAYTKGGRVCRSFGFQWGWFGVAFFRMEKDPGFEKPSVYEAAAARYDAARIRSLYWGAARSNWNVICCLAATFFMTLALIDRSQGNDLKMVSHLLLAILFYLFQMDYSRSKQLLVNLPGVNRNTSIRVVATQQLETPTAVIKPGAEEDNDA